ncbi:MAG: hypothetical protein EOO40_08650 [Deltaproteobacteria bacterium]|nr:MAG: hypothetical protein EOO40_08650 [Deltaproteobacteria bacterium]
MQTIGTTSMSPASIESMLADMRSYLPELDTVIASLPSSFFSRYPWYNTQLLTMHDKTIPSAALLQAYFAYPAEQGLTYGEAPFVGERLARVKLFALPASDIGLQQVAKQARKWATQALFWERLPDEGKRRLAELGVTSSRLL